MVAAAYIISTGRSGTTLLGKYLSGHPELIMRSRFPYETRTSQHLFVWASAGRSVDVLEASKDPVNGVSYAACQADDSLSKEWFRDSRHLFFRLRALDIASRYYEYIATVEGKSDHKFYIEKAISLSLVPRMHQWGWPLRCILLVRDPRDIFFSVKAFNKKRGFKSFGEERLEDDGLVLSYINFFLGARHIFETQEIPYLEMRYEDLIESPAASLERVGKFLGVSHDEQTIGELLRAETSMETQMTSHMTTQGRSTVGRWRSDASYEHKPIFDAYAGRIRRLGYDAD